VNHVETVEDGAAEAALPEDTRQIRTWRSLSFLPVDKAWNRPILTGLTIK
jgi:hypothetical protein